MATHVSSTSAPSQPEIRPVTDGESAPPEAVESEIEQQSSSPKTGIYNLETPEGRAALQRIWAQQTGLHFDVEGMNNLEAQLSPEQLAEARSFTQQVLENTARPELASRWRAYVVSVRSSVGPSLDINALVQLVLRMAYLQNTEDLGFYAEKVKNINQQKKLVREHLLQSREYLARVRGAYVEQYGSAPGSPPSAQEQSQMMAVMAEMAEGTGANSTWLQVRNRATVLAADQVVVNFSNLAQERFGLERLPQGLVDRMMTLLSPPTTDEKIRQAVELAARFIGFLSDRGLKDGRWEGQPDSCDDYEGPYLSSNGAGGAVTNVDAVWEEFGNYGETVAATNLAAGDIELLIAAFAVDPANVHFTGETDQDSVVAQVTNAVNDRWANEMFVGTYQSTAELSDTVALGNWTDPEIIRIFGSPEAAREAFWGDPELRRMYIDLGIPAGLPPPGVTTFAELETHIDNFEEKLNGLGDDAQLANVDLQNMLQKQQQNLQQMSNISKMLYDTAMAVIRKYS